MQHWKQIIGAAALLVGSSLVANGAGAAAAPAGTFVPLGQLEVTIQVAGLRTGDIDTLVAEVYASGSLYQNCDTPTSSGDYGVVSVRSYSCTLPSGSYALGISEVLDAYKVSVSCGDPVPQGEIVDAPNSDFTIDPGSITYCTIYESTTVLVLEKSVESQVFPAPGDLLAPGDFTLEVFDGSGTGAPLFTGVDPSANTCSLFSPSPDDCFAMDLADGDYVLGEVGVYGYQVFSPQCSTGLLPDEAFTAASAMITASADPQAGSYIRCEITNWYGEGEVSLTKTLTNDDGGTAVLGDFTLELYRTADGSLVTSGVCAVTGICLEGSFPVGTYTVGEVGPDGYTRTVAQVVINQDTEQLTEVEATFDVRQFSRVEVEVASDDIAPTTTTTTVVPTTIATTTTTTVAPTTVATTTTTTTTIATTTTAFGAGGVLPATGSDGSNTTLTLISFALLAIGGGALLVARRRA